MTSMSRSWHWWAVTASTACLARLGALQSLIDDAVDQWATRLCMYLMKFMFHTTLDAVGNILWEHYTRRPASADRTARRQFQATGQPVSRTQASDALTSRLPRYHLSRRPWFPVNRFKFWQSDSIRAIFMAALCNRGAIIFLPCSFFLSSSIFFFFLFFPRLISAAAGWMSTILWHMVWP